MYYVYACARTKEKPMINILTTNTLNAGMRAVIDQIAVNGLDEKHVVIVPDAHALSAEKIIFDRLDLKGSMNIEVVSFMRFASKTLQGKIGSTLSKQGAVLFFKKVINRCQGKLVHYGKSALTDGFAGEMYAVISSVRNNGISIAQFEESLLKLSGTTLNKAKDILLLYKEYMEELGSFTDSTTRLEAFKSEIANSKKIEGSYVYIYGFDSLSEKQIEIISALGRHSKGVTIGLAKTNYGANHELYPFDVINRLTDYLKEQKVPYEVKDGSYERIKEPFNTLHQGLFMPTKPQFKKSGNGVVVFKERDVYAQYNAVAREIIRLVRREGLRFNDIAVVDCGEPASMDFKEILMRYGIPHFIDERYPLTISLYSKFIVAILDTARFGYRLDKVRNLVKNPLFSTDFESICEFENYIIGENLNYDNYKKPIEDERFEGFRHRMLALTTPFERGGRVDYFVDKIVEILESDEVKACFEEVIDLEDATLRPLNEQAKDRIIYLLSEYKSLIGDEVMSPLLFKKTLLSSLEAEEIALIPRYIDAVYVGTLRESCIIKEKALFVVGATQENLPTQHGYQAIVSPLDMDKLTESGVKLYPTPIDRIREERFAFIDLITKTDRLYVGYPEIALDGSENKPSEVIKDTLRLLDTKLISLNEQFLGKATLTDVGLEDAVGHQNNAFYTYTYGDKRERKGDLTERLVATLKEEERKLIGGEKRQLEAVPLKYTFGEDMHSKVSQIEQYFTCPYRHYLQYGLGLQDRKEGVLRVNDVGTFVHNVLEYYFKLTLGKLRSMTEEERALAAERAISKVFDDEGLQYLYNDPSISYLLNRLRKECYTTIADLTKNVLKGDFDPSYIELEFSAKEGKVAPVKFKTPYGDVAFHGKIDRVDVLKGEKENLAIAIDYKTGSTKSSLSSVYYGQKLQLYLYLLVLQEVLELTPVGSFYMPVRSGYTSGGRSYRFQGQVVFEEAIIKSLDREVVESVMLDEKGKAQSSTVLPLNISFKNGEISSSGRNNKISREEMANVLRYVKEVVPIAIKEIVEGNVARSPIEGSCANCAYRATCGGIEEGDEREYLSANSPLNVAFDEGGENGD